jgi:regulatory protein
MKITSIEPQQKNSDRVNLYLDNEFCCGLTTSTAARLGLYMGKEVSTSEISNIDTEEEYQKCMNAALNLASRRLQSEKEYWQKLGKKYDKCVIGRCLDRLRVLGYANDKAFAEMWVRERSASRGNRLLESELFQKGIGPEIIENLLSKIGSDSLKESAMIMARKKYKPSATKEENFTKTISYLTRKGYSYSLAKEVLESLSAQ